MSLFNEHIVTNNIEEYDKNFFVQKCGITFPDADYSISHDNTNRSVYIEFVTDGTGFIDIDEKVFTLTKGYTFIIPSHLTHSCYSDKKNPFTKKWICLSGELVDSIISTYFDVNKPIIRFINIERYLDKITSLMHKDSLSHSDNISINTIVFELILVIKECNEIENYKSFEFDNSIASQIEAYILSKVQDKFSLTSLCKHFSLTESQAIRLFKNRFGKTPYRYYTDARIEISKNLLRNTTLTIDDIASKLYFNDRNHYTKLFVKYVGISPAKYRKNPNIE